VETVPERPPRRRGGPARLGVRAGAFALRLRLLSGRGGGASPMLWSPTLLRLRLPELCVLRLMAELVVVYLLRSLAQSSSAVSNRPVS
jgi:hypothetical protein